MDDTLSIVYAGLAILVAVYVVQWASHPLRSIPTVGGPSAPLFSYLSARNFAKNGRQLISQGYDQFHGAPFKVALWDRWMVVVSGHKLVDDLRKRPDDELSFIEGVEEVLNLKHTTGRQSIDDPYHVQIIREKLMRALSAVLPDVIDELGSAIPAYIPTKGNEWVTVNAFPTMQEVVARASSRVFVGLPICRNRDYLQLAIRYTVAVFEDQLMMRYLPGPLKRFASLKSVAKQTIQGALTHVKPLIDERKEKIEELGDGWNDKPNDMLQWIIEEAIQRGRSSDLEIVDRLMLVNFAAIHTSSNSVTHALYHLASVPEWIEVLRAEVEPIIVEEGWTKTAIGKMRKLDSLMRETMRLDGIAIISVTRKAMKDLTLVDGTFIPKGTLIGAASYPTHRDDNHCADAGSFDPWRWSRMREGEGEGTKHQFVNTSLDYISFGHGRHACPGRFFAANELKALLVFMVIHYDFKLKDDGPRPSNVYMDENVVPDPTAQLMFRKRQVVDIPKP